MLSLEISDNGRGLSATDLAKARSFGIRGLHERASTVGGWVDLSSDTAGTSLILSIPLPEGDFLETTPGDCLDGYGGGRSGDTTAHSNFVVLDDGTHRGAVLNKARAAQHDADRGADPTGWGSL